jgi:SNF2 family DNA or RNA helicase
VLVCSYGLLQREAAVLASRRWSTVVLDEAQSIKNSTTLRSRAAFGLQADFRVATTGTPVENRLDELWSLFKFLMPNLLGTKQRFGERFGDGAGIVDLRKLVRPFILRRLKSEVLEKLPPRTDVVWHVEPGAEEASIYEALRLAAAKELEGAASSPQQRMQVLSWITKLRLACCDPRLVHDGAGPGAKRAELQRLVEELRAGGHKALIFSQFVKHLELVREWMDEAEIPYQYLDGSTPAPARAARVGAFQAGEGDVFLISLKAGGTGLNLTAANYVIHLDPWWNPAVEDQASDRAHRIGQTQAVTVYRLVVQGTIEQSILELHDSKRALATELLAGTSAAPTLDASDLLALITDG